MAQSSIEWTESTWNPTTGCTKISSGCKHCYAERMAHRLKAMGQPNYANGFAVATHGHVLEYPLHWRKPQTVFVNSMSDLFHEDIPVEFIRKVFDVMQEAHWHRFQVLTKRAERLEDLAPVLPWPENVWMGVTVENREYRHRIDCLRNIAAAVRFLSVEPLLGPWGRQEEWVLEIRDQCLEARVPFFFKQWGGVNKKRNGRLLQGRTWDQMPAEACSV